MMTVDQNAAFEAYIANLVLKDDPVLDAIYAAPQENDMPLISINPVEGYLLGWLARLVQPQKIVEIGVLAGYSGVWLARALEAGGKLYGVEISNKHAAVAQKNFELAGVADRVEVLQGASQDILPKLAAKAPFDVVFIDADKKAYVDYLHWAAENLRTGGLLIAHNAFRHGAIIAPVNDDDRAMVAFHQALAAHPQFDSMLLPLGDAMAVGIKHG